MAARYSADVTEVLSELRSQRQLCDGVLRTEDGGVFYVHRAILAVVSPYFKALFINSLTQGDPETSDATLRDISSDLLGLIVDYAYKGVCHVTHENVGRLLPVSDRLGVLGVVDQCCEFLIKELKPFNSLGVCKFAKDYLCANLEKVARKYSLVNFPEVVQKSAELKEISAAELESLLSDDELNVKNEKQVFETVVSWVEYKLEERKRWLPSLLNCVRFGLTNYRYLSKDVWNHRLIMDNQDAQAALYGPSIFLAEFDSSDDMEVDLTHPLARPRQPHEILLSVGGWTAGSPTCFIETYDVRADRWFLSMDVDVRPRAYHGLEVIDNMVYMVGGFDGNEHFNSVRCYDPVKKLWTERACMYTPRCYVSTCVLDAKIYAMGGYDGRSRLNSCERYDPRTNQWEMLPSMHRRRSDASADSLGGKVYVVGGFDGQEVLNSVEVFDPTESSWSFAVAMNSPRSGVSLVAYNDSLYALGGFDGARRLRSGERFALGHGGGWTNVRNMFSPRSNFASTVLDGSIYVIGGFNGSTTIPDVECYDEQRDQWEDVTSMNVNRSALSACVLRDLVNGREYSFLSRLQQQQQQQHSGGARPAETPPDEQQPPATTTTTTGARGARRRN